MSTARLSIIPGWLVTDQRLKGRDLQVLCVLGRHTSSKHGWCRRSQVKMSEEMGCARSTVQASLDRLVVIGAVERRVVASDSGRDSAHWYRVIYDRETPESAFQSWDNDGDVSDEEFGPISDEEEGAPPCRYTGTPADISAPPAGPESAPPAGPGSAPINDSCLTAPAERTERERASDDEKVESRQSIERGFKRWFPTWPTNLDDSETEARKAWYRLTPAERRVAIELTPAYLRAREQLGRTKKGTVAAGKYLHEKRWQRLGAVAAAAVNPPSVHKPFSKAWQALAISRLLEPDAPMPAMTPFLQQTVKAGGPMADRVRREHRQRWAWPKVSEMYAAAEQFRGQVIDGAIVEAGEGFKSYHVDSAEVQAYRQLYERMEWPWPRMGDAKWICFPLIEAGGSVEAAIETFKATISEGQGDHDAA
ncbi:helix-turn-helix domain-containing protein [Ensifer sp. 22460]|uniref:helix-turn-helix domain-containing protein n=1 Tax=Ensifer sp. 22460 TaxID=3453922 RepID=UPI003F86C2EA